MLFVPIIFIVNRLELLKKLYDFGLNLLSVCNMLCSVFSQGTNAADVKILEEAGIYNYDDLMMHVKKV